MFFRKNLLLVLDDVPVRVVRTINRDEVQLENTATGEISTHKTFNLLVAYDQGRLLIERVGGEARARAGSVSSARPDRLEQMTEHARQATRRRIEILARLRQMGSFEKSRKEFREDLERVIKERGETVVEHVSTVYKWRRKYLRAEHDVQALIVLSGRQGGKDQGRLDPAVEAIISNTIEFVFLEVRRATTDDVYKAVLLAVQQENARRPADAQLEEPSLRTVQRRVAALGAFDRAVARYGRQEAERRFAAHAMARRVSRILELVEVDHTPVDLLVVDENRVVIGRPTFTVIFDRYSRCVLGYCLSLAGYGVATVFAALRHAMLPKTYLSTQYPGRQLYWPCFGWMERLLLDNAVEFHALAVQDAMTNLSVLVEYAASRDPNDKPFVERLLHTFNYSFIHKMPGTTLSNVHQRIGFQAEKEACITLEELDEMVHIWICDVYHRTPHRGLDKRAPIDVWLASAAVHPPLLKMDRAAVDIEFSNLQTRTIQHYGIELNTFVYTSARLCLLRRMLPANSTVQVKWPEHDVGHVWVWDPTANEYFEVPNKDPQYAGMTLLQAQVAKKARAKAGADYRLVNAEAKEITREIIEIAAADKRLKVRRQAARVRNDTTGRRPDEAPTASEPPAEVEQPRQATPRRRVAIDLPDEL